MVDPAKLGGVEGRTSILNVGTRILLKDIMDQYVRTLGDYKTHYASNMAAAVRVFQENQIHIVIAEVDLPDASVYRLFKELGGSGVDDDVYFILALEERNESLLALAEELEADAVLVKPFSAADLRAQVERYNAWKALPKEPWKLLVAEARQALREKRFTDIDRNYVDAIGSAPNNPAPLTKAAQYYISKPDYAIAETLLKKALALRPNHVQALSALGSLYLAQKDLDRAHEYFAKAQALSPLNPDRALELVRLYLERCTEACRSALRIDAGATAVKLLLGKLLTVQKDYAGAVRELERALPLLRDNARNEAQTYAALARKLGGLAK